LESALQHLLDLHEGYTLYTRPAAPPIHRSS
jgi:hypothetical protein